MAGNGEPEDLRKVFVGGLNRDTKDEDVKSYFDKFGTIVDFVVIKDPETKTTSRGFGFVTYDDMASVDKLLSEKRANGPITIDNKKLEVKRSIPRENSDENAHLRTTKMFVAPVHAEVEEQDLKDTFNVEGDVKSVTIPAKDGVRKKFAFVEMGNEDEVDKCVIMAKFSCKGKDINVRKATPKGESGGGDRGGRGRGRGQGRGGRGGRGGGGSYDQGYGGYNSYDQGYAYDDGYYGQSYGSYGNYGPGPQSGSGYGSYGGGRSRGGGYGRGRGRNTYTPY